MRPPGSGPPICGSMPPRSSEVLGVGSTGPTGVTVLDETGRLAPMGAERSPERAVSERDAWAVLAGVHGLGPVAFGLLLRRYRTATAILTEGASVGGAARLVQALADADRGHPRGHRVAEQIADGITAATETADATVARIRELGLTIVTLDDAMFPNRLAAIEMPPHVLYVLGDPAALDRPAAVAIVGTRRATDNGRAVAARIATNLALVGASVVSGLAVGIDGAAHAAAVNANGITVAVIGSGHATITPSAHRRLAHAILAGGGAVVSELGPDVVPSKGTFPRRNRIISGLADATVVVEAPARSGALITASWALEQGRDCYLVPGPIDAPASAGCLAFLREFRDTTRIVAGVPQLIDDLGLADHLATRGGGTGAASSLADVGEAAGRLGRELVLGRHTVDELVAVTGWPVAAVLAGLTLLERRGLAVGVHGRFRPAGGLAGMDPAIARQRPRTRSNDGGHGGS
jgi:DNA processing protein